MRILILLLLLGCKTSEPPKIEICLHDGNAGADCDHPDKGKYYRPPSELTNYWMTNQPDMAKFSSWCYDSSPEEVNQFLDWKKREILRSTQDQASQ